MRKLERSFRWTISEHVYTLLSAPIQLAVGVSGGVEMAAIAADLGGHHEDLASYSLDVKNAYWNMIVRLPRLAEVLPWVAQVVLLYL